MQVNIVTKYFERLTAVTVSEGKEVFYSNCAKSCSYSACNCSSDYSPKISNDLNSMHKCQLKRASQHSDAIHTASVLQQ